MVSIRTSPRSSSPKVTASRLGRVLHVTEEAVYTDSSEWSYLVIDTIIQSGTTEHSAFVIRKDSRGFFIYKSKITQRKES